MGAIADTSGVPLAGASGVSAVLSLHPVIATSAAAVRTAAIVNRHNDFIVGFILCIESHRLTESVRWLVVWGGFWFDILMSG